ncbi:B-cell differentiation antigen CD72-like [Gallus gallus]|nr:B-cell differentiation antigen CD72-like [Gallus gallus]XP_046792261.1 B-cell differentiation antigen CD72-like [Gallus gallus]|eukprot:XP_001231206.2 B-cell differentiation antigen CD72-like [Gallus gallus]
MAQSVLYADLRFAKGPGGHSTTSQVLEADSVDDTDSPYENVVPGPAPVGTAGEGTQHSPGHWSRRRCVPVGLLAAMLLLLVALVALGTCYWQVTHQLQNVSMEQATERGHFSQKAQVWEQNLEQTQQQLAWVQEELQQAWQEAHHSQQELARREAELVRVSGALNVTQKELQDMQGKLSAIKQTASSLHVCLNGDCCPSGWLLYHGKCLFISAVKKSWWGSYWDCVEKHSHLLVQGESELWVLPRFLQADGSMYWIGREDYYTAKRYDYSGDCVLLIAGKMQSLSCKKFYPWICEQPPTLSSASESLTRLLTKD